MKNFYELTIKVTVSQELWDRMNDEEFEALQSEIDAVLDPFLTGIEHARLPLGCKLVLD